MVYIPDELFNNPDNEEKVMELHEKYFGSDVVDNPNREEEFFAELEKLNEPKVYEFLKASL